MKKIFFSAPLFLLTACAVTTELDLKTTGQITTIQRPESSEIIFRRLLKNFKVCYTRAQVIGNYYNDNGSATITVKIDHGNNITNIAFTTIEISRNSNATTIEYWLAKGRADWDIPKQIQNWASGKEYECKYKAFSGQ